MTVVTAPIYIIRRANTNKAERLGVLSKSKSGRTWSEAFWHYAVEFDGKPAVFVTQYVFVPLTSHSAVGVTFAGAGLTLLLLPFSIAGSAGSQ